MVVSVQIAPPDFDRMFGALADHTRRDIVRRAINAEEGVVELASHYPMSFAAVQKHVAVLERAGLVTKERIGRRKVVRTNLERLRVARRLLDQYEELWRAGSTACPSSSPRPRRARPMTVTAVRKDPQTLTMTLEAEFDASPERVWQLWADPRQLERWWGPPTYPATFTRHDLAPGSRVEYHMTGPDGRPAARLLGDPRGRAAASPRLPRRLRERRRHAQRRPADAPRSASTSRRSATGARACRSRASSRAPRPWSRCWPWAWRRA